MSVSGPVGAMQIKFVGSLNSRFLLPDRRLPGQSRQAITCRMQSVSLSELAVESDVKVTPGEHFEAVFEELGPLRGKVLRSVKSGFVVALAIDAEELVSLSRTIEWLKKRHTRQATNTRASPRFDIRGEPCTVYAGDIEIECRLADVSTDGAMLVGDAAAVLDLHAMVKVGRVAARVVRRQPDRIGVEFTSPQSLKTLLVDLKAKRELVGQSAVSSFFEPGEQV
ncbi:MAG: PilZ domain-containing protein [Devosia sp.]